MFPLRPKSYKYGNTRRYVRLPAAWPIKCEPQSKNQSRQVSQTTDVSAGGVAVGVREMVPVGSRLQVEIYIPPVDRTVQAEGQVVRCQPNRTGGFELGIRFDQIDPKDQTALNEAIERFYSPRQRARQSGGDWWRRLA